LIRTVQRCLDAPDMAVTPCPPFVAEDLLAIMKGLVDAAGDRGESDDATLVARVNRAVFGYLEHESGKRA
jgi:hypothetical protein